MEEEDRINKCELDDIIYFLRKAEYSLERSNPNTSESVKAQYITNDLTRAKTLLDHYIIKNNKRAGL